MEGGRELSTKASQPLLKLLTQIFWSAVRVWRSGLGAELETAEGLMKHGGTLTVPCPFFFPFHCVFQLSDLLPPRKTILKANFLELM